MKLRDLLAVPFWALATLLDYLAVTIGSKWTAQMYLDQLQKLSNLTKEKGEHI